MIGKNVSVRGMIGLAVTSAAQLRSLANVDLRRPRLQYLLENKLRYGIHCVLSVHTP
jgi:hypothetical protein